MTIQVHIERLTIKTGRSNGLRGNSLGPALEQALARRLGARLPQTLKDGGAFPSLTIPHLSFRPGLTEAGMAEQIADALVKGLESPSGGRRP
jgi:hypothetical protein